jgi:hypothetical protein
MIILFQPQSSHTPVQSSHSIITLGQPIANYGPPNPTASFQANHFTQAVNNLVLSFAPVPTATGTERMQEPISATRLVFPVVKVHPTVRPI